MRIIIADDSSIFRERIIVLLNEIPGLDIAAETKNVPDTIQTVKQMEPEILLLDIQMPGGSGVEVLQVLKKKNKLPETVIVITNYPYPQYKDRCLKEGAHHFLDKTNESEKVIEIINDLIQKNLD